MLEETAEKTEVGTKIKEKPVLDLFGVDTVFMVVETGEKTKSGSEKKKEPTFSSEETKEKTLVKTDVATVDEQCPVVSPFQFVVSPSGSAVGPRYPRA